MDKYQQAVVVDDQIEQIDLMSEYLQLHDIHSQGVTTFDQFKALYIKNRPDLIVLDISMPDHDAYDYIDWLSEQNNRSALIFMSGLDNTCLDAAKLIATDLNMPVLGVLHKPFTHKNLGACFER